MVLKLTLRWFRDRLYNCGSIVLPNLPSKHIAFSLQGHVNPLYVHTETKTKHRMDQLLTKYPGTDVKTFYLTQIIIWQDELGCFSTLLLWFLLLSYIIISLATLLQLACWKLFFIYTMWVKNLLGKSQFHWLPWNKLISIGRKKMILRSNQLSCFIFF